MLLRAMTCAVDLVLALEGPPPDAKERAQWPAVRKLQRNIGIVDSRTACPAPARFQMGQQRDALLDGHVLAQLQFARVCTGRQSPQPTANAGRHFARIDRKSVV